MPSHDAESSRRELANRLDFVCFSIIILLYGAGAVLIAALEMAPVARASAMFVAVSPLAVWLAVMVVLRRYLEDREMSRKRYRRQLRESDLEEPEEPEPGPALVHVAPTVRLPQWRAVRGGRT
ncbi:MAG: hypothetical protein HYX28_06320 [Candidatus Koribacter versatilis]|uniref:Uncharacterized protein n=1 Tax=Candidatus Korobacter versatilis TaxID=658062 RepID=A0A932A928_9BACT|nr:hypothetical protein [Candidatus Koribacter versatilis]